MSGRARGSRARMSACPLIWRRRALVAGLLLLPTLVVWPCAWAGGPYRLEVGDTIDILVWGQADLSRKVVILPDGQISYPLVGQVDAAGLSLQQLTEKLRQGLSLYYVEPHISLSVTPAQQPEVYVQGSVVRPGAYRHREALCAVDYLAQAGGALPGADLAAVLLISPLSAEGKPQMLDLEMVMQEGDMSANAPLNAGDILLVPEARSVGVVGQVRIPGAFPYLRGHTLTDYVAAAGGVTNRARTGEVTITRVSPEGAGLLRVDLGEALRDPAGKDNVELRPGDVVSVPEEFLAGTLEWADVLRAVTNVWVVRWLLD